MSISDLAKRYGEPAGDDVAGPELRRRGVKARDELIRMLDRVRPPGRLESREAWAIAQILDIYFQSEESYQAIQRLRTRLPDVEDQRSLVITQSSLRARLRGVTPAELLHHLDDYNRELQDTPPEDRFLLWPSAAVEALRAGKDGEAEAFARQILAVPDVASRDPKGVNSANVVLGTLALRRGDVALAKQHLIESAKTKGTYALSAWGPDTSLAQALLNRGERDVVLEYLALCKAFRKHNDGLIERWQGEIRTGKRPDLSYRERPFPLTPAGGS
jgi:hypothetical protein